MSGLEIRAPELPEARQILTQESLAFIELLARHFGPRRQALLQRRREVQRCLRGGELPNFLEETRQIRCLLYTSPSPRDGLLSRMPSSA